MSIWLLRSRSQLWMRRWSQPLLLQPLPKWRQMWQERIWLHLRLSRRILWKKLWIRPQPRRMCTWNLQRFLLLRFVAQHFDRPVLRQSQQENSMCELLICWVVHTSLWFEDKNFHSQFLLNPSSSSTAKSICNFTPICIQAGWFAALLQLEVQRPKWLRRSWSNWLKVDLFIFTRTRSDSSRRCTTTWILE